MRFTVVLNLEFDAEDEADAKAFVNAVKNMVEYHGKLSLARNLEIEPDDLEELDG